MPVRQFLLHACDSNGSLFVLATLTCVRSQESFPKDEMRPSVVEVVAGAHVCVCVCAWVRVCMGECGCAFACVPVCRNIQRDRKVMNSSTTKDMKPRLTALRQLEKRILRTLLFFSPLSQTHIHTHTRTQTHALFLSHTFFVL